MNKRLTRSDYLFSMMFLLMLVLLLGSFFFGLQTGTNRAEARYQALLQDKKEAAKGLTAYHQTYLVSFYHTIYLPYRDFQNQWFQALQEIDKPKGSADPASLLKELGKSAHAKYDAIVNQAMPESSPLLIEAHDNYLKSLKLFEDGTAALQSKAGSLKPGSFNGEIRSSAALAEAKSFALKAQRAYYDAMVKWNESANPELKGLDMISRDPLAVTDWKPLNLNLKNDYLAAMMAKKGLFENFTPQDLAIRVDEMIGSGEAQKLKLDQVDKIVDMLTATSAVRQGDFLQGKALQYTDEPLPLLPFFSTSN